MLISKIATKTVNTKFGAKSAYSIQADGEWYSYGFKKPAFNEGDEVNFSFTDGTYGKSVDVATVRVITKGSGSPATASTSASKAPGNTEVASAPTNRSYGPPAKVFPIPALHGDRAIVRQNSLTNAVNLLKEYFSEDVEMEQRAQYVINIARMFEAYSCGDLDMEEAKKMIEAE
jgi:hypothetical protein